MAVDFSFAEGVRFLSFFSIFLAATLIFSMLSKLPSYPPSHVDFLQPVRPDRLFFAGHRRRQVSVRSEATTSNSKRPRKKKTLAELKVDEALLLKEWNNLTNEIATMRLNVEKQRVTNESLKRYKSDLESRQEAETVKTSAPSDEAITAHPKQVDSVCEPHSASDRLKEVEDKKTIFSLPDLNLPAEGDVGSEALCAMS